MGKSLRCLGTTIQVKAMIAMTTIAQRMRMHLTKILLMNWAQTSLLEKTGRIWNEKLKRMMKSMKTKKDMEGTNPLTDPTKIDLHKKVVMDLATTIQVVETGIRHPKISTVTRIREKETEIAALEANITNLQRKEDKKLILRHNSNSSSY